jgi:hypothetical protein
MRNHYSAWLIIIGCLLMAYQLMAKGDELESCNITWTSQSRNSSESMPCGGGDIGLNVWVENGDLFFYISRSGTFDENNAFLKLGRVRLSLTPNPFDGADFEQQLNLQDGSVYINGTNDGLKAEIHLWVDVFQPVIHLAVKSNKPVEAVAGYESWRYKDRLLEGKANNANSYKWGAPNDLKTLKDSVRFQKNNILFYHRNSDETVFDVTVKQQKMDPVKQEMFNPLKNLIFGGLMKGRKMVPSGIYSGKYVDTDYKGWKLKSQTPSREHEVAIYISKEKAPTVERWESDLQKLVCEAEVNKQSAWQRTREWWQKFWQRSFVFIRPDQSLATDTVWQAGRNYQLFRYMLACNAYGEYPTKFNGGLFTFDPVFTDTTMHFTPDHRNWGGGTFTQQNQRLVYFPMLKSGDFDLMKPQFDFYLRALRNAELRSEVYWGHKGACFTEQLENFGLPNFAEYGTSRPAGFDPGMQYNAWLEYLWDTAFEFGLMELEVERYCEQDISQYLPFIKSCLTFFDEHYQYLARKRGIMTFDGDGKLVLFPGSGCETYKMVYNSTSTIAALKTILSRLLELPSCYLRSGEKEKWQAMLDRIPEIGFLEYEGHQTIAPAWQWQRINNVETPQLYPIFPWGIYGIGKPGLDLALNTWMYDPDVIRFKSHVGWKQYNIFAARLGLTDEAASLTVAKLKDSARRFPAFWGPGFDWVPDHNWGGSGMIGMQEMLLQVDGRKLYLFPAWPKNWNVHFKLHAPYNTTVEGVLKNGKLESLKVFPVSRTQDIVNCYQIAELNEE